MNMKLLSIKIMGSITEVNDLMLIGCNRFLLFLLVGGINTLFGYGVFALFIFFDIHYIIATLISTVIGILFNFKSTGRIVFKNKNNGLIFRFFTVYAITFILNVLFLKFALYSNLNIYIASFVITIPVAFVSYILQSNFVFRRE